MSNEITRKDFLTSSSKYAVGAVIGVAGLDLLAGGKILANPKTTTWPWPYVTLDPEVVRLKAHHLYYSDKDCCSGVFGAFTQALTEVMPDPWANMPMEVMLFGRGGGNGWGTLCGAVNGAAAIISLVTTKADSGKLINEIWGWAAATELPTAKANQAALDGKYQDKKYNNALVGSVSGSVICHASVSQWCAIAKKKVTDTERKERCARLAGDLTAKTAEILNAHFAKTFVPTFVTNPNVNQCQSCHGSSLFNDVMTQMDCVQCHGVEHAGVTGVVDELSIKPSNYQLSQNYPNPFNPSTNIRFSVPQSEKVHLAIYDIKGSLVKTIVNYEEYNTGTYQATWDGVDQSGKRVASGIYFARLLAGQHLQTIKMNLVK